MRAAAVILALLVSPLLGYDDPSPRLPGQPNGRRGAGKCPYCGGKLRRTRDDILVCNKCGRSYYPEDV